MDTNLVNDVQADKNESRKSWNAPKLTEVNIADHTEQMSNAGSDGFGGHTMS